MEKTNTRDFPDQVPEGGNRQLSYNEDPEIEWNDEFIVRVEEDPAANIRPYMDLFPGFEIEELLSLMPVVSEQTPYPTPVLVNLIIESYSDHDISGIFPPQLPGELSPSLESWNKRFPGNDNATSIAKPENPDKPQDEVTDANTENQQIGGQKSKL
ncbi:hypothetical protein Q3G72_015944 [Acer saccharum]|nr:hypothetical protein Q3G72_015944 [Acer saccharum]